MSLPQVVSLMVLLPSVFGGRHEDFLSNGWSFIGNVDRSCSAELDQTKYCDGVTIPPCDSSTNGKTVQDRKSHNECVAQGCETGSQYVQLTYHCQDRCNRLDIDGYLTGCSTTIDTMSTEISSNKAEFDTFKVEANTAISTNKAEFDSFKVDVNIALDEIADFNAAHAPIVNIDHDLNTHTFISLKDSVIFGLLFLNLVVVIYVFCALKAQNRTLKAGYSRTYNKDIIENASEAEPMRI
eukprot:472522_1